MEKLKKIINQLDTNDYQEFESVLTGNNSAKFLFLFKSYTEPIKPDEEIKEELACNDNALYVLKSRLYDKIQRFLLDKTSGKGANDSGEDLNQYLYNYPRETAIAMLSEIESNYLASDASDKLINVYSALKKAHYYSDKYYTYSQLYNKQVAYNIALEKAEDTLFNFNRTLANYYFSSSDTDKDLLKLLKTEIRNIFALNKSARIELILNIISIQTLLFTDIDNKDDEPVEDLLAKCEKILEHYKDDSKITFNKYVIAFLQFEYYTKINQHKKAMIYFDILNQYSQKWLLQSNSCIAFKFLLSKADVLLKTDQKEKLGDDITDMYLDPNDLYTNVIYKLYSGISHYFQGKIKSGITILNDLLNEVSFKNYFYIETEIKLFLAYLYVQQKEYELAENVLKSLTRKIGSLKGTGFRNVKEAIKIFTLLMNGADSKSGKTKIRNAVEQFNFYNFSERKILSYIQPELDQLGL